MHVYHVQSEIVVSQRWSCQHVSFLDFPRELRDMVYLEIFHIDEPRRFTIRNEAKSIEEGLLSDLPYVTSDNQTR